MGSRITTGQVTLPEGGGAIHGVVETFRDDEFTGGASLSIPIPLSPCRDFEPHLSVEYGSGGGNGIFGFGYDLSVPSVSRKTAKGLPRYDGSDTFVLSGADDLVPTPDGRRSESAGGEQYQVIAYRPRTEGAFIKIEQWLESKTGASFWRLVGADNVTSLFGKSPGGRLSDPQNPGHVFQWLLEETFDTRGNHVLYEYEAENVDDLPPALYELNRTQTAARYLSRIKYGNVRPFIEGQGPPQEWHFEVAFDYGRYNVEPGNADPYTPLPHMPASAYRQDSFSTYHAGFEIRTRRLCRHVLMFHRFVDELGPDPVLVHATRFVYQESPALSLLRAVESVGYQRQGGAYRTKSLPPLEFKYSDFRPTEQQFEPLLGDDGRPIPGLNSPPNYLLVDLYGEGIPGILYSDGGTTLYWEPEGDADAAATTLRYAPPRAPLELPIGSGVEEVGQWLTDLTGSGQLDLLVSGASVSGYYEANPDRTWESFRPFVSFPTDFSDPNYRLVDLTGDGLADVVRFDADGVRFYPSRGKEGFGPPLVHDRLDGLPLPGREATNEVLRFADLFGTGTQHLVRVTSGRVECWPSLGYGRFGAPVLLDNAPRFEPDLDASRLYLADVDGSGTADLVYAYPDRVEVFLNRSGNSFGEPVVIPLPGGWDRLNQIEFADIYGDGTACLIFCENHPRPRYWSYRFNRGQKPYLLNGIDNNLGARTSLTYASSTKFYLADKRRGTPWVVNLPFPVQVLEKVESLDLISQTRLVSTYTYHHGHYDGVEREFRGFGMVERRDAETLSAGADPTDVPPLVTKTWYHTGAWLPDGALSRQYAAEYFQGDAQAHPLPDSDFDYSPDASRPDAETWLEAYRALKGMVLREEVYAPDAPASSHGEDPDAPYTVTETNYTVRMLQPRGGRGHGVYFVHPRETLTYHYERNPHDPRVEHDLVLEVDDYGNTLRSCSVVYGRRPQTDALPEQLGLKVTYAEDSYTNRADGDVHLLSVPTESRTYHVNNLTLPEGRQYFDPGDVRDKLKDVSDSPDTPLVNWERHHYWCPDTNGACPAGKVSPQDLLFRTEGAVFNSQQVGELFAGALAGSDPAALMGAAGGYVREGDYWWNPGLSESYYGAEQFYLPRATTDPFGHATDYSYDQHCLLLLSLKDALNNEIQARKVDYQALLPQQTLDSNGNVGEVLFDPLKMVAVTSHYGSEPGGEAGFMRLDGYRQQPLPTLQELIGSPQKYLQGASEYFHYDLLAWAGQVHPKGFDGLGADGRQLWGELVAAGYLSSDGGVMRRCRDAATPQDLELGVAFDARRAQIFDILRAAGGQRPAFAAGVAATNYPADGAPSVSREQFDGLGRETQEVWDELVSKGYLSPGGAVLQAFWDLPDAKSLNLGGADAGQSTAVFNILKGAVGTHLTYSDGFGRVLQDKRRVESGEAFSADGAQGAGSLSPRETDNRWLTSGRKVYNNKGDLVRSYEPYFIDTPDFIDHETLNRFGVSSTTFYDALGHVTRTQTAKGFLTRAAWTPWSETDWDENDTLKDSPYYQANVSRPDPSSPFFDPALDAEGRRALAKAELFNDTPDLKILDNLGRTIQEVRQASSGSPLVTRHEWDAQDNLLSSADPRLGRSGLKNFQHAYNLAGQGIRTDGADSGRGHRGLLNVVGNPVYTEDPNGNQTWTLYDELHRVVGVEVQARGGARRRVESITYGDSPGAAAAPASNLRGEVYRHFDQGGLTQFEGYSILGLPLTMSQRFTRDYRETADWSAAQLQNADALLQERAYTYEYEYDALGRLKAHTDPASNRLSWQYHLSGLFRRLRVQGAGESQAQTYFGVEKYNPRGQRLLDEYGAGAVLRTEYSYDPKTFALTAIRSTRAQRQPPDLQDLRYTYDPAGNLDHVQDNASAKLLTNDAAAAAWETDYTYDALYRLTHATGVESLAPGTPLPLLLDAGQSLRAYACAYAYDDSGNLWQAQHRPASGEATTTALTVARDSNRAVVSLLTTDPEQVGGFFDANGNQLKTEALDKIEWNFHNDIRKATRADGTAGEFYVYNAAGRRVRKVAEHHDSAGAVSALEETLYLGNLELRRRYEGAEPGPDALREEMISLRVKDDQRCVATRIHWTQGKPAEVEEPHVRYALDNHQDSCVLEVDAAGNVLSYEQYYPYGGTALAAGPPLSAQLKSRRYSGKERDEATGLYYFGARYYAPWSCRWLSPDPAGTVDGLNLYSFAGDNPATYIDLDGLCRGRGRSREREKYDRRDRSPRDRSESRERPRSRSRSRRRSRSPRRDRDRDDRESLKRSRSQGRGRSRSRDKRPRYRSPVRGFDYYDRRQYFHRGRDQETDRRVRRMDAIARLFDIMGSIVTAVGYDDRDNRLVLSVNRNFDNFSTAVTARTTTLRNYFAGRITMRAASESLAVSSSFPVWRLAKDLRKLKAGAGYSQHVRDALFAGSFHAVAPISEGVHAELTVWRSIDTRTIGVTKLNCAHCAEYLSTRDTTTRGTHGYSFPGWRDPERYGTRGDFNPPPLGLPFQRELQLGYESDSDVD
jgi:RHS repeat-associated protein